MFSSSVYRDQDLTVHRATGPVTVTALRAYLRAWEGGAPTRLVLWDLTEGTLASIREQDILKLFGRMWSQAEKRRMGRTALVVSRTVDFGVGRMMEMVAENLELPFEFRVFWEFDPAENWLYGDSEDGDWVGRNPLDFTFKSIQA